MRMAAVPPSPPTAIRPDSITGRHRPGINYCSGSLTRHRTNNPLDARLESYWKGGGGAPVSRFPARHQVVLCFTPTMKKKHKCLAAFPLRIALALTLISIVGEIFVSLFTAAAVARSLAAGRRLPLAEICATGCRAERKNSNEQRSIRGVQGRTPRKYSSNDHIAESQRRIGDE